MCILRHSLNCVASMAIGEATHALRTIRILQGSQSSLDSRSSFGAIERMLLHSAQRGDACIISRTLIENR